MRNSHSLVVNWQYRAHYIRICILYMRVCFLAVTTRHTTVSCWDHHCPHVHPGCVRASCVPSVYRPSRCVWHTYCPQIPVYVLYNNTVCAMQMYIGISSGISFIFWHCVHNLRCTQFVVYRICIIRIITLFSYCDGGDSKNTSLSPLSKNRKTWIMILEVFIVSLLLYL